MPAQGDIVGGFSLVRRLGAGGMGETWEAVRRIGSDFEQRVAIKLPNPELLKQTEGRNLLRREASLAASLRHPNIAAVIDWNEEQGFIVCELVEGAPLSAVLQEAPSHRLPAPLLVHMLAQVGRGLSHAHRRLLQGQPSPVVHRDMSPSNLVVDYDGNVKIVDFGIAKTVGAVDRSKSVKGKLAYMAPEQASGHTPSPAFDQYALGVIAYEAAAGERPNDGAHDGQTLKNILNGRHVPVGRRAPELPSGLADVIERMLALDPADRFPTMDAAIEALEPFTPPLGTHRSLAVLVQRAHPPETIVQEDGRFVSRPVTFELVAREAHGRGGHVPIPLSRQAQRRTPREGAFAAPAPPQPEAAARGVPIDAMGPTVLATGTVLDPHLARGRMATPPPAPLPRAKRPRYWAAGLIAALLAFVGWAAWDTLSPRPDPEPRVALGNGADPTANTPAAAVAASQQRTAATAAGTPGGAPPGVRSDPQPAPAPEPIAPSKPAGASDAPPPLASAESSEPAASKRPAGEAPKGARRAAAAPAAGTVAVRVKVFPWGRVWIDGAVRGSVPPILQARLRPGSHTIAAGQEHPEETRTVEIRDGDSPLIAFDLSD